MTLLEDRPQVEAREAPFAPVAATRSDRWLDTSDHKRLGLLFVYAALAFGALGGVLGLVVGAQQVSPSIGLATDRWLRLYSLHTMVAILLFLTAIWIGLATYVVPLQIGSGRLATPRLLATGFWLYLIGGGCFVASYIVGPVNGGGIVQSEPIAHIVGGANTATALWIVSLALISAGFLMASASLFATVAALRTDGMTLLRVPAFSWATMVASAVTVLTTPIFLAGLLLLYLDQHFGGNLFDFPKTVGSSPIWQHTVWLYGRPDVFLLTLVGLGAATDIVTTHARRPLLDHRAALVATGLFGVLTLTTFAMGSAVTDAVVVPTYAILTSLVVVPLSITVLLWLGTMARGRPRFHVSLLFVAGAITLWITGAANAVGAALQGVNGFHGNSAWVAGNVHVVVAGAPTLLAFGALYHWAPKIWGRRLSALLGSLAFLSLFTGLLASGLAYYFLGYNGVQLGQVDGITSYQKGLYGVAEAGGALVVLGVLIVVVDLAANVARGRGVVAGDDPYEGLTLEWATTSPPPRAGFDCVPEVRSAAPLLHLRGRAAGDAGAGAAGAGATGAGADGERTALTPGTGRP
jgi:cytochrome c oxidase subunit I